MQYEEWLAKEAERDQRDRDGRLIVRFNRFLSRLVHRLGERNARKARDIQRLREARGK